MKKLSLLLLVIFLPEMANAYLGVINGIKYYINTEDQSAEVRDNKYSGDIVIPATVEYGNVVYNVTSIGAKAFYNCTSLTSIDIPNSITSIGLNAFQLCNNLTSVFIHDITAWCKINFASDYIYGLSTYSYDSNPLSYGAHRLYVNNEEVKELLIPNSVTSISNGAFYACQGLTSVNIPNSVNSIGDFSFSYCSNLGSVSISNSVTEIGNDAFRWCISLTSLTIPNSVTSIGNNTFYNCSDLNSIDILCSPTNLGSNIFGNCENLKEAVFDCRDVSAILRGINSLEKITLKDGVTSITSQAFYNCTNLSFVTIPNSVTSIGNSAFENCTSLPIINIPNSVNSIGERAFYGCI